MTDRWRSRPARRWSHIYKMQGRYDEARRLVRDGWTIYPDRVGTLQELARLDSFTPISKEDVEPVLEKARIVAPDDDRRLVGIGQPGNANRPVRRKRGGGLTAVSAAGLTTRSSGRPPRLGKGLRE